jgi:hypothetical protein
MCCRWVHRQACRGADILDTSQGERFLTAECSGSTERPAEEKTYWIPHRERGFLQLNTVGPQTGLQRSRHTGYLIGREVSYS